MEFIILLQAHCLIAPRIAEVFESNYKWMIYGVIFFQANHAVSQYQKFISKNQVGKSMVASFYYSNGFPAFFCQATIKAERQNFQYSRILIEYINICWYVGCLR